MERKDKGDFQTQGNPKIPEKEIEITIEDEADNYEEKKDVRRDPQGM